MSARSRIEWTDATWNPTTGCNKVSAGCKNCYAERMAERLQNMDGSGRYRNGFTLTMHDDERTMSIPERWKKPKLIFVNSMSDLFHERVTDRFILDVFDVMSRCPQHIFQVLTKRPRRLSDFALQHGRHNFPTNLWLGTSIESSDVALERLDLLAEIGHLTDVAVRFVSFEPLLGPISLRHSLDVWGVNWAIVGGESGPRARPMLPDWARSVRAACRRTPTCLKVFELIGAPPEMMQHIGVPLFFKQWGEYNDQGVRVGKKAAGRLLDGVLHDEMPQAYYQWRNRGIAAAEGGE